MQLPGTFKPHLSLCRGQSGSLRGSLGLQLGGSWTAQVKGSAGHSATLQAAFGPVWLRRGLPDVALVIRNPGLSAFQDWRIEMRRR